MLVSERIGQFFVRHPAGHRDRLEFTEYGSGDQWVVLLPAPLLSRRMHQPLARSLAAEGMHVLTLDPLGHGRSDRPGDPLAYSATTTVRHVLDLMDHMGAPQAVLGGSSLGANAALATAVAHPDRVRGLLLAGPVLDNALQGALLTLTPLMMTARYAPPLVSGVRLLTRNVPRGLVPFWAGVMLDACNQRPRALAALLHGTALAGIAPDSASRSAVRAPALVIGPRGDPWHPFSDARLLADELPGATLITSRGLIEWRDRPGRVTEAAVEFVKGCWTTRRRRRRTGS